MDQLRASVTREEQRAFIKLHVLLDVSATEVHRLLDKAVKSNAMSLAQVKRVYNQFKSEGRKTSSREPGSGKAQTSTSEAMQERLKNLLLEDNDWGTTDYAQSLEVSRSSVLRMFEELGARKVASRWVPHELDKSQMNNRMAIAEELLKWYNQDNGILQRIISIDETYLKSYDPRDSESSKTWCLPGQNPYVFICKILNF